MEVEKKIDDGGPAFPHTQSLSSEGRGLTKRDYFAAKAMQALVESSYRESGYSPDRRDCDFEPCEYVKGEAHWYRHGKYWIQSRYDAPHPGLQPHREIRNRTQKELLSRDAYEIADAMIAASKK